MTDDNPSPLTETDNHDYAKYAYHQGARIIRAVADWISEATHTGTAPDSDDREQVYDMLIELHQLLYGVTLYPLHKDGDFNDDVYDDGRPAISRIDLTGEPPALPIPAGAYHDIGDEAIPFGCSIYVWRPGGGRLPGRRDGWRAPARLGRRWPLPSGCLPVRVSARASAGDVTADVVTPSATPCCCAN
jgi:hypothetical protein